MKKIQYSFQRLGKVLASVLLAVTLSSCDSFFDVVPEDAPDLHHAFSNRTMLERSLYTAYSYLPDPTDGYYYPAYYTTGGEFLVHTASPFLNTPSVKMYQGNQNSNSPLLNYWTGENGGIGMFKALRWCNIFLENCHIPQDITSQERERWIAEVKFLKAYYHYFLMTLYGPIPLIKENIDIDGDPEVMKIFREPIDECVAYIVELIDEALPSLPDNITNTIDEMGRVTKPIALAVKAKALVWAASPLFNGNTYYSSWVDKRGKRLIPEEDLTKWEVAAQAVKEAIESAELLGGHHLYEYNKLENQMHNMPDEIARMMTIREAVGARWNPGIIWGSTEKFATAKGGFGSANSWGNMQYDFYPMLYAEETQRYNGYMQADFSMTELFYSKNGVPIDEDKEYDYANRYDLRVADDSHQHYLAVGQKNAVINFDREPRYYADLAFDRGYYELESTMINFGESCDVYVKNILQTGDHNNMRARSGYNVKKMVSFRSGANANKTAFTTYQYSFPLIRLADLYLLYAEAMNEAYGPSTDVYTYIDAVREKAGLKGVVESWQNYSTEPTKATTKEGLREIIHRERLIELAFEGQRFWDVRRWKEADQWFMVTPQAWDKQGKTPETYYKVLNLDIQLNYTNKHYLWPIKIDDLRKNYNLVQTYGW